MSEQQFAWQTIKRGREYLCVVKKPRCTYILSVRYIGPRRWSASVSRQYPQLEPSASWAELDQREKAQAWAEWIA